MFENEYVGDFFQDVCDIIFPFQGGGDYSPEEFKMIHLLFLLVVALIDFFMEIYPEFFSFVDV